MFQNFKTDIIYYNTSTDFELEFNLCGCCRMRLLNDKCADKKTLLASLSRAFSRSRVIILTAPLFDGSNIIKTVSVAIGKSVEKVDLEAFNIKSTADIEITKGSVPLVTADGIFGGCIIESGPQTLIMLTDNKSVRKTIMKDLIHPYIEELASGDTDTKTPSEPENTEEIITEVDPESEETIEGISDELGDVLVTEETESQSEEVSEEYYESEELITEDDNEPENEIDENYYTEDINLYTENETARKSSSADKEEDEYYDDYYIEDPEEEKNSAFNICLIVISAILLLAIAVLCFCIFFVPASSETTPAMYLKEIFDTMFK